MSDTPLTARARLTMTTNIATYFRNRPPRGVGGKPASLLLGEKFDISIAACAQGPRLISTAYITFHIILVRCSGKRGRHGAKCDRMLLCRRSGKCNSR